MSSYLEKAEEQELFRQKPSGANPSLILNASGSAGRNPVKLAQILSIYETVISILGWQDRPIANLTRFLVNYQASIDAKYHNDFKEVLIAEEIERRRTERKGISILQQ